MSLIRRLLAPAERRDLTESGLRGTWAWPKETAAGVAVTSANAMTLAAVYACVRIIAETLATLPLNVYRDLQPRGREKAPEHPWYRTLHDRPNPYMSNVAFWESMIGHAVLRGNAYAEKVAEANGTYSLYPLRPDRMTVEPDPMGRPVYSYRTTETGAATIMPASRLLRIYGLGFDGLRGYSPVTLHREAIGLGMALQEYGSRLFSNGARPGGVLQAKDRLSEEAIERMGASWAAAHQGLESSHRVAILEEGVTWQQVGMVAEDAQFLESRRYQLGEIARIFRVQPHKIGDLTNATFSNIEHQAIEYVVDTIRPWAVRIEAAIATDLIPPDEGYSAKFVLDGLLRGDVQSRYAAYSVGHQNGWLSANDIRELEDQNPIPADQGGDTYMVQLNMTPAGMLGQDQGAGAALNAGGSRSLALPGDQRAAGTAGSRLKIARNYRRLFVDAVGRLVAREANEVGGAAASHLARRDAETFITWLRQYYERFPAIATRQLLPVLTAYAEAILGDAAAEIGSVETLLDELMAFVQGYAASFGEHYAGQSLGQLENVIRTAIERGEDIEASISQRLSEWQDTRAEKVADRETTRASGALVVARWRAAGVLRVVWQASGENCPFCTRMNGKVVATGQPFATEGEEIEGNESSGPLKVGRSTAHPPIHDACNCGLRPDRG